MNLVLRGRPHQPSVCCSSTRSTEQKIDEAIDWSDYLCVCSPSGMSLRQHLQRRVLKGRIRQAEEARRIGKSDFDASTLKTFENSVETHHPQPAGGNQGYVRRCTAAEAQHLQLGSKFLARSWLRANMPWST